MLASWQRGGNIPDGYSSIVCVFCVEYEMSYNLTQNFKELIEVRKTKGCLTFAFSKVVIPFVPSVHNNLEKEVILLLIQPPWKTSDNKNVNHCKVCRLHLLDM